MLRLRRAALVFTFTTMLAGCESCGRREDRAEDAGRSIAATPTADAAVSARTAPASTSTATASWSSRSTKRTIAGRSVLAQTESATGLSVDDEAVYAIGVTRASPSVGTLIRFPLDGSQRSVLAEKQPIPYGLIAHDSTDVYYVVRGVEGGARREIRRVPKRGGDVTTLFDSEERIVALAVEPQSEGRVLAATQRGSVLRVAKDGKRLPVEVGEEGTAALVVDGDTIYGGASDRVWTRKLGATSTVRALSREACTWMQLDATHVYCARPHGRMLDVVRLPKATGHAEPVCSIMLDASASKQPRALEVEGLAVDDQRIYVSATHATQAESSGLPVLFTCAKGGGAPSVLVQPHFVQTLPIDVTRGELFWAEEDSVTSTRVMRSKELKPDALDLAGCYRDDATGRKLVTSDLVSDLDQATAIEFIADQNDLCGDTFCEGDYDFYFHDVRCSTSARTCHVSMRLYGGDKAGLPPGVASIDVRDGPVRGRVVGHDEQRSCKPACMETGEFSPCSIVDVVCELDVTPPFEIRSTENALNLGRCIHAVERALRDHAKK
jgi:hypothetical protein